MGEKPKTELLEMKYSVIKKSETAEYDFGHLLFSPDFFQREKIEAWRFLEENSTSRVSDWFMHIRDTVNEIDGKVICYDLTHGLPKFFDAGDEVTEIGSTKKIAQGDDFAIARLGSYLEEMGLVEHKNLTQLFSTEFLIFRAISKKMSTCTLFALCMTDCVQTILKYGQYGTTHPRFYDFLLTHLPVPDCLQSLDDNIQKVIKKAMSIRVSARDVYREADSMLLSELGLVDWQPKSQLTFVKNSSDIKRAGRIDAEYFQPKYGEIIQSIKKSPGGWRTLDGLITITKNVEVGSQEYLDDGIPFVRVSNISPFEITEEKYISENLYQELQCYQPNQGDILFSKDATPGVAHYLSEQPKKMIPSGGILRLTKKSNDVNNEYLLVALNSILTKEQVNRDVGGSVILHWRPDQVQETIIPILPKAMQNKIREKVRSSFRLRAQSKHLLECAKRAVEIAIRQGEQAATEWLKNQKI